MHIDIVQVWVYNTEIKQSQAWYSSIF